MKTANKQKPSRIRRPIWNVARISKGESKMETTTQPILSVRRIVVTGVLGAIAILLGYTRLGFIPVPTPAGNATIMHIPAIIGGILEGWPVGAAIGTIFGIFSFLQADNAIFKDPLVAILPRIFIGVTPYFVYRALRNTNRTVGLGIAGVIVLLVAVLVISAPSFAPAKPVIDFVGLHFEGDAAWQVFKITGALLVLLGLGVAITFVYFAQRNQMELLAIGAAAVIGTLTNTVLVLTMIVVRGYLTADVALSIGITQGIPEIIVAVIITVAVVAAWRGVESGVGGGSRKV
jgi:uncharacterized membrane protein